MESFLVGGGAVVEALLLDASNELRRQLRPSMNDSGTISTPVAAMATDAPHRVCDEEFLRDVIEGLQSEPKRLHCKYLYDQRGSQLFDQICDLPEYYPTRTETKIMQQHVAPISDAIGPNSILVEFGSGSSTKTRTLLAHKSNLVAYLPVDISREHLLDTVEQIRSDFPDLKVHPIVADFTQTIELPRQFGQSRTTVYFPGSTIGNLESTEAEILLGRIATLCGAGGGLLIGFDLAKDPSTLVAAYDDAAGVTAEFNLNLLRRINRELDAEFDLRQFQHVAIHNDEKSRIEIYIESLIDQDVRIGDESVSLAAGERILTEYSHKYSIEQFAAIAKRAGLIQDQIWTDEDQQFAVMYLRTAMG